MIDTHTHLNFSQLSSDLPGVLERARSVGVTTFIVPSTTAEDSASSVELSELHNNIYAAIGIHPTEVRSFDLPAQAKIKELLEGTNKVVSIGEVGLDYYHFEGLNAEEISSYQELQKDVFTGFVRMAEEYNLPLIIHSREAFADTLSILRGRATGQRAVIHCFTGSIEEAEQWLSIDCMISLTAIITYTKNGALRDVVRSLPLERVMLETDSPFLPPEGHRGEICEPKYLKEVAECIAEIKGISFEEVDAITSENAKKFFEL